MNVPIVAGDLDDKGYKPRFVRVSQKFKHKMQSNFEL